MSPIAENKANATVALTDHPTHHNDLAIGVNKVEAAKVYAVAPTGVGATDTAAINAAIAALPAAGGVVELARGEYLLNATIALTAGVTLRGQGSHATTIKGPSSLDWLITATGTMTAYASRLVLTANALKRPTAGTGWLPKVSFNTAGVAVNDYLMVGSDEVWVGSAFNTCHGEIAKVRVVDSGSQVTLWSMLNADYPTAQGAFVQRITFMHGVGLDGIRFVNTTPNTNSPPSGLVFFDLVRSFRIADCRFENTDDRAIKLINCIDGMILNPQFWNFEDQNTSPLLLGYGVDFQHACQWIQVIGGRTDRLRHAITTNGANNSGITRNIDVIGHIAVNCTNYAFDTHTEAEHITFSNCRAAGGAEYSGTDEGGGQGGGWQIRSNRTHIKQCEGINNMHTALLIREGTQDNTVDGFLSKDTRWTSYASAQGARLAGDRMRIRNLIIEGSDGLGAAIFGSDSDIDLDVREAGMAGTSAPIADGAVQFFGQATYPTTGNRVRLRARDCVAAVVGDSTAAGPVTNNLIDLVDLANTPIGSTTWVKTNDQSFTVKAASPQGTNVNIASPGTTLDGVTLAAGDRILLKDQTTTSQNGPWVWLGGTTALARPTDLLAKPFDTIKINVEAGTENDGSVWQLVTPNPITLDTTGLRFTRLHPAYSVPASSPPGGKPMAPTNAKIASMDRWGTPLSNQAALASGTIRVFPMGVLRAGVQVSAINLWVATTASAAITNSWGGIVRLSDRAILAISATSTATTAANTLKTFTFTSALTPDKDEVVLGFVMYQATTVPTLAGVAAFNALQINNPVVNGTSNTAQTTPLSVGTVLTAFTAANAIPFAYLT